MDEIYPNSGGPAFPVMQTDDTVCLNYGMSKRDYFAAHAPVTMDDARWVMTATVGEAKEFTGMDIVNALVGLRLLYADQMLAALAEK